MGLILRLKLQKCVHFVVIALSLIATAFTSTHEEALSEATELIATMKKKGATEADCKDLARTTCKEVLSEVKKAQKIIDSQSSGAECDRLGQRTVIYATRHYHKRMTQWRSRRRRSQPCLTPKSTLV